jgi:hypothetical protein
MISLPSPLRRSSSAARAASSLATITRRTRRVLCSVPLALTWSHSGVLHRVTHWPEVQFERLYGNEWLVIAPSPESLATAAKTLTAASRLLTCLIWCGLPGIWLNSCRSGDD